MFTRRRFRNPRTQVLTMRFHFKRITPTARIEAGSMPEPNSGCWLWLESVNRKGYAHLRYEAKMHRANRFSYSAYKGQIPEGLMVLHSCDNPLCVNPEHLSLGTAKDNNDDRDRKGRHRSLKLDQHPRTKFALTDIDDIRASQTPATELAAIYGVSKGTIAAIKTGRNWKSHISPNKEK